MISLIAGILKSESGKEKTRAKIRPGVAQTDERTNKHRTNGTDYHKDRRMILILDFAPSGDRRFSRARSRPVPPSSRRINLSPSQSPHFLSDCFINYSIRHI